MKGLFSDERGSALIVTLLLVSVMTGLVADFVYDVYIDSSTLSNWSNAQKASLIAKSGQTLSAGYLSEIKKEQYTDISNAVIPIEKDFGPGTSLTIYVSDENSRFNINTLIEPNGSTNSKALLSLTNLFEKINVDPDTALLIADWIDPDSEPRLSNSEDTSKNSYFWSIDELKLVNGIDTETFEKISPFITAFGDGKININTAELPVLACLDSEITDTLAQRIIDYRETAPFENPAHLQRVPGMESIGIKLIGRIVSRSSYFRITSSAKSDEIERVIESVMDTSLNIHFWREG